MGFELAGLGKSWIQKVDELKFKGLGWLQHSLDCTNITEKSSQLIGFSIIVKTRKFQELVCPSTM